jgi:hypothetical protein
MLGDESRIYAESKYRSFRNTSTRRRVLPSWIGTPVATVAIATNRPANDVSLGVRISKPTTRPATSSGAPLKDPVKSEERSPTGD